MKLNLISVTGSERGDGRPVAPRQRVRSDGRLQPPVRRLFRPRPGLPVPGLPHPRPPVHVPLQEVDNGGGARISQSPGASQPPGDVLEGERAAGREAAGSPWQPAVREALRRARAGGAQLDGQVHRDRPEAIQGAQNEAVKGCGGECIYMCFCIQCHKCYFFYAFNKKKQKDCLSAVNPVKNV